MSTSKARVNYLVSPEDRSRLQAIADRDDTTISAVARRLLKRALEAEARPITIQHAEAAR